MIDSAESSGANGPMSKDQRRRVGGEWKRLVPARVRAELMVRATDLAPHMQSAGISEPVTEEDAVSWRDNPDAAPAWFRAGLDQADERRKQVASKKRDDKHRKNIRERERARAKRAKRDQDKALCSPAACGVLGMPLAETADLMRSNGVSTRLVKETALGWVNSPETAPDWLIESAPEDPGFGMWVPRPDWLWEDDFWEEGHRPDMDWRQYEQLRRKSVERFASELEAVSHLSVEELYARGQDHADQQNGVGYTPGPFVSFLAEWNAENAESDQQRLNRLAANYLRHQVTSYDHVRDDALSKWWMPQEFFNEVWLWAMTLIVERYPQLQSALDRGLQARLDYDARPKSAAPAPPGPGGASLWGEYPSADQQREARAGESAEARRMLSEGQWSVGEVVQAWGRAYGRVVRVNQVTVKVRLVGLKRDNYAVVEKNIKPQYLTIADPSVPGEGERISLRCHDSRTRQARVTAVDAPLFEAEYRIKSGDLRRHWFDSSRIESG